METLQVEEKKNVRALFRISNVNGSQTLSVIWCGPTLILTLVLASIFITSIVNELSFDDNLPKKYVIFSTTQSESSKASWVNLTTISSNNSTSTTQSVASSTSLNKVECDFKPAWIHFGFCDDESNVPACQFDFGDCCLDVIKKDFCTECICKEDNSVHEGIFEFSKLSITFFSSSFCIEFS